MHLAACMFVGVIECTPVCCLLVLGDFVFYQSSQLFIFPTNTSCLCMQLHYICSISYSFEVIVVFAQN